MSIKGNLLVIGLGAATLFLTISVSAATWTTKEVSGTYYQSGLLNYGDGTRTLKARGISGTGSIKMSKVNKYLPDSTVASVNSKVGIDSTDSWNSVGKLNDGTPQSYYYTWTGGSSSSSANMTVTGD